MGRETGISWCDATWNPIRGCSRVSEGCRHCYAEGVAYRFSGPGGAYEGLVRIGSDGERRREWNGKVQFVEKHLLDPLKWHPAWMRDSDGAIMDTRPLRIFVNSMSDLFHENVTDEMRDRIFAVMALCPQHAFQILTKRPDRMLKYLGADDDYADERTIQIGVAAGNMLDGEWIWKEGKRHRSRIERLVELSMGVTGVQTDDGLGDYAQAETQLLPLPNVHLGVSCENQATADERIPLLLQTPAAVRFISAEPLLGPIDLLRTPHCGQMWDWLTGERETASEKRTTAHLDWVIVGGESGPGARPCDIAWIRSIIEQCKAASVPCFVKQLGREPYQDPGGIDNLQYLRPKDKKGGDIGEWPEDLRVMEFPR